MFFESAILGLYLFCLSFIFIYSLGQFYLAFTTRRLDSSDEGEQNLMDKDLPKVTVQLPIYNEKYVVERLIECCANFDYPLDRFEIQVLDDSDDDTTDIAEKCVEEHRSKGVDISLIRRPIREGFKAGALKYGLGIAKGEFLAIFDSDFLPPKEFLRKAVEEFSTPEVGMVQFPWGHINHDYNGLTRLQAFGLEAHFLVEQLGKHKNGFFLNFNGTAGMWRKSCIVDAGNWQWDTLTEDLDLSYRAQLKGWKFKFADEIVAPAELPIEMNSFRAQQSRWTKGAAEASKKLLPQLLRTSLPFKVKLFSILHLLNPWVFIASFALAFLSVPALAIKHTSGRFGLFFDLASIFVLSLFFLAYYFFVAGKKSPYFKVSFGRFLWYFPYFLAAMMGLSFHNSLSAIKGWFGKKSDFIRTPKFNSSKKKSEIRNDYVDSKLPSIAVAEFLIMFYFLGAVGLGIYFGDLALFPYHLLLAFGFFLISTWSFKDAKVFARG